VAIVDQLFTNDTSDVSGAAGYENLHDFILKPCLLFGA